MKKIPRQAEQAKKELREKQKSLVEAAFKLGQITKKEICDTSGLKMYELNILFKTFPELHTEFNIRRKTLVDLAADNIVEIVSDSSHPNNFAASKFVLSKYKSDLDGALEKNKDDEIEIEIGEGNGKSSKPVLIRFGKKQE